LLRRLVEFSGHGISVRRLGGSRAGEMRLTRLLHSDKVTVAEMVATAAARTQAQVAGRHVLAIQDTTTVRAEADGRCTALHAMIAVDAVETAVLGLVDAQLQERRGGKRDQRRQRAFVDKESRRWLDGSVRAGELAAAGAACVTVVADREGDIYEDFALKPDGVEVVIRASQDRALKGGTRLFGHAETLPEAGRMTVELAAAPGRRARTAELELRFATVEIARPVSRGNRAELAALPSSVTVSLVEAREVAPPADAACAHWRLLTTHAVADVADARRILDIYRQRWTIEQLFRTLKTKGFDVEALRLADGAAFENLVGASVVAAVTVMQLVHERDGRAKRPLEDAFDRDDQPALEAVSASLEGRTARQKNPHPKGSLAYASWVCARLGGWTGYYGKPGPVVMLAGLIQFHAIKHGWSLRPGGP
jgi:hypothetical protein